MKNRQLLLIFLPLLLAGCDGPNTRKNLAECQLAREARDPSGSWNENFLKTCMQEHGYIVDNNLKGNGGTRCGALEYPQIDAGCYRIDTLLGKWLSKLQARRPLN